ncbi:MAG: PAS domain S-box protein [Pirellulales bacterium]|nr:PAS domain S-box protein [Pirellulales bacterium]
MGILSQMAPDGSTLTWLVNATVWLLYGTTVAVLLFYILRRRDLPFPRVFWYVSTYVLAFGAVELMGFAFDWSMAKPLSVLSKALIALVAWGAAVSWVALVPWLMRSRAESDLRRAEKLRKKAEKALRESEIFYRTLIDGLPINIFRKDVKGRIVYGSLKFRQALGYELEDLIGKTDHDLFPQELAEKYVKDDEHVLTTGESLEDIERHPGPDGTEMLVQILKAPVRDSSGQIVGVQGMFWDVTSRERAEEAHRESEARLTAIMDNTASVISLKNEEFRYLMINRRYEQLLGVENSDVIGKTDFDIWPRELAEAFQANDRKVLETGRILEFEEIVTHDDGPHTYLSVKFPLRNAQGDTYAVAGISTDITGRKQAELALQESEDRRNLAMEAAKIGTWTWSIEEDSLLCDQRLHKIFGWESSEFQGAIEGFFQRVHPDDRAAVRSAIRDATENNKDYDVDFRILRGDPKTQSGEIRNIVSRAAVVRDADGKPIRMTGVCLDVTERERAEQALHETQMRMRRVVESAHDAFIAINAEGNVIEWNREAERTFGWKAAEAVGQPLYELIVPEPRRAAAASGINSYLEGGEGAFLNRRFETEALRRDGTLFPVEMTITPLPFGETYVFSAFLHDITSRRQAEEALRKSDARFRRLVESNIVGITVDHFDGRIVEANDAFLQMTGYTRADLKQGKLNWEEMTPGPYQESTRAAIETLRSTGVCTVREKDYFRKDGTRVPALVGVTMLEESGDECICVAVDITERRRALADLQAAKEQADAANEAKSRFLANMSHEIRTPMNAIIGLTELVLDTPLETMQRDYLQMVQTSAESLLTIINDVLDYSKIEAGKLEVTHGNIRVRELVGDLLKSLGVQAHERHLELAHDVQPDVPEFVIGDGSRLRQILTNLIGNAIKFTERGEVVVNVELESRQDNTAVLKFVVRDTGIGIAQKDLDSIFEAFEQVDTSSTRRFAGTGLGLAITQRLVTLLGGEIWVDSEPGRGSRFHFTCPISLTDTAPEELPQAGESLRGLPVLVVDDNATNGRILQGQLVNWGMRPTVVADANAAMSQLTQAAAEGNPFLLALVDGNMPVVDGFQLTEQIRGNAETAPTLILMLTSGGRPDDIERCEQLGISRYLTKPVKQSELLDNITSVVVSLNDSDPQPRVSTSTSTGTTEETAVVSTGLKILLAEDSLVNQKLAIGLLQKKGHHVHVVENGEDALKALEQHEFDVVLMDVQMPQMDGLEATAAIRKHEQQTGTHLPIIAMTAHAMQGDRERCLEAGMDDYVAKPIRSEVLYETINQLVGRRDSPPQETSPDSSWITSPERLDWHTAWETVDGDLELLRELIGAFLQELPQLMQQLTDGIAKSKAKQVRMAAHTIKGSLRYFGAKTAYDLAFKLESGAEDGTMAEASDAVDSLRHELAAIDPLLRRFLREPEAAEEFRSRDRK